jgi:hypothetical protein
MSRQGRGEIALILLGRSSVFRTEEREVTCATVPPGVSDINLCAIADKTAVFSSIILFREYPMVKVRLTHPLDISLILYVVLKIWDFFVPFFIRVR